MDEITALELYNRLLASGIFNSNGTINFELNGTSVTIKTTDIVGNCIQSWLKQWMIDNNIFCAEPHNTQEFPDFYLSNDKTINLLEVKAFNYNASPAFDIANFEAYCSSLETKAYRLNADYIIFGYEMNNIGVISIKKIWLKKIWEISGKSTRYALNTQIKRDVIYNIRPVSNFKNGKSQVFSNKEDFLMAIYQTLCCYRGIERASQWKEKVIGNYFEYTGELLNF